MRPIDVHKTQEILDVLHPYLKWGLLGLYALMVLYVNRIVVKDPILRRWVLNSFNDEHNPNSASGKILTAFVFAQIIAFATVVAIIYSPSHLIPEYFLISILSFIAALYGIKMASKYLSPADQPEQKTEVEEVTKENNEDKKE